MVQIPGVYVEIKGDYTQLNRDMRQARQIVTESAKGMSDALNNALSPGQLKSSINKLVADIGQLSRASEVSGRALKNIGVDLGELQKVTGMTSTQFSKLQSQLLQTQAAKAQENALRNIGKAAGLSQTEIAALGKQFGLSQTQIANVAGATTKAGSAFQGLIGYLTPAVAGFLAVNRAIHAVSEEFVDGLKAVEDFGMSVAQSTALITTFSQRAKNGDIAGAYQEANAYAKELTLTLEMIDQKTIANSKDLRAMSETFIANGVLLDAQNQKQVEGFTAVANALAIMTQGQNKEVQMRQEIRGLMDGEIRSQDKLGMLLKAQIPDIEKQLVKWRDQGVVLEKLGELLQGFNATTGLLENQWATVGSTMETIHNRILRGMFEPVFNDLIKLAKEFNKSLMDAEGNLTPLARGIIKLFNDGYASAKTFFTENDSGWASLIKNATVYGRTLGLVADGLSLAKNLLSDYGNTGLEKTQKDLDEIQQKIEKFQSGSGEWWEFQLFKDPNADKQYLQELTAEAERLSAALSSARESDPATELRRTGGAPRLYAPKLYNPPAPDGKSNASDLNAAMQAEVEALKAAEERKLAIIKASLDLEQQEAQNAYELGLSTYSEYLAKKNSLTEESLQATLDARKKELASAEEALAKLSPITDKEGNARPDKDTQARANAEKKVEDAKRGVIEAEKDLQKAESEGVQAAVMAGKERSDAYKQAQVEALQLQGRTVEAAWLQAEIEEGSIERQRLIREAALGSAEAQAALDAARLKDARAIADAEEEVLERRQEAALALAEMDGEYYKSLDVQTQILDVKIKTAEQNGALEEEVELLRRQRQELERMKNPLTAMVKGWEDVIKHQKTSSELMYDLATETAQDMQGAFSDILFDGMDTGFENIGDIAEDEFKRIYESFLRMIADMVAAWAATELFQFFTNTGDGDWFTYFSNAKGKGSNSGAGGVAGTVATAVAQEGVKQYVWTPIKDYVSKEYVSPAWDAVKGYIGYGGNSNAGWSANYADALMSGSESTGFASEYAGQIASQWASEFSSVFSSEAATGIAQAGEQVASQWMSEFSTILDEASQVGSEAANFAIEGASMAANGGVEGGTMVATGAAEGGSVAANGTSTLLSTIAEWAGPVGIALQAAAVMVGISTRDMATKDQLNNARITPGGVAALAGIGKTGELTNITEESSAALQSLIGTFGSFNQISVDAASGVMVLGSAITDTSDAQSGLITGMEYQIATFNNATGVWERGTANFGEMIDQMRDFSQTTDASTEELAYMVAEANKVPTVADELAQAFGMMQTGIYGLSGAALDSAGTIAEAISIMRNNPGINFTYDPSNMSKPYNPEGYTPTEYNPYADLPGHADGGFNAGWTWVGEKGKELIYTPPSQIFSNTDSNKIMSSLKSEEKSKEVTVPVVFELGGKEVDRYFIRIADQVVVTRGRQGVPADRRAYI